MSINTSPEATTERRVIRLITLRLIPFVALLYVIAYVDRSNVGFAKLTLQEDLGISNAAFFMGSGMFFIAYAIFEVPSNIILVKVGARKWFTRILVSWGVVTVLTALMQGEATFYIFRFLLGVTEAGFYAGILFFLTQWFPKRHRAKIFGLFIFANPFSFIIGNPLLGLLSGLDGTLGLAGWQWIFIVTGIPAIILGFVTLWYLPDTPRAARWLPKADRVWLEAALAKDNEVGAHVSHPLAPLKSGRVWLFIVAFLMMVVAAYGLSFWLPTIVQQFGVPDGVTGFLTTIPYLCAAIALAWLPSRADRKGEHFWHMAIPLTIAGIAMASSLVVSDPAARLGLMAIAAAGILAPQAIFWSLSSRLFNGIGAATALAAINSVGNLGGWLGPLAIGGVVDQTGSTSSGLWIIAGAAIVGALLVPLLARTMRRMTAQTLLENASPLTLSPDERTAQNTKKEH